MILHGTSIGSGAPVLLIHGLFGMSENLGGIARGLADAFTVHSVDLRNHGRSPRAQSMTLSEMAGDVAEYMARHEIDSASLLGHSLGGKVAMQLALNWPQKVKALVVADMAPVLYPGHHDDVFAGLMAVNTHEIASRAQAGAVLARYIQEDAVRLFLLKNLYRDDSGAFAWRINVPALDQCYEQMRQAVSGTQFGGKALFLRGGDSDYVRDEHLPLIAALFPNYQLQEIAGAGHWLHAEKPAEFNEWVRAFFSA